VHAHVQKLASVVKMATLIEEYITEEQCSLVRFLWAELLNEKNIHKEMFPVYCGKCLSRKQLTSRSRNAANISILTKKLNRRCGSGWVNTEKLLCCGFRRTGKATGQVYISVGGGHAEK
jgi:hypothetical protein